MNLLLHNLPLVIALAGGALLVTAGGRGSRSRRLRFLAFSDLAWLAAVLMCHSWLLYAVG